MSYNLRGWLLLKLTGIVYMVASAVALFVGIALLFMVGGDTVKFENITNLPYILIISGAVGFTSGIIGFLYCNERKKVVLCLVCGVALAILTVFLLITLKSFGSLNFLYGALLIIFAVFYLGGALLNRFMRLDLSISSEYEKKLRKSKYKHIFLSYSYGLLTALKIILLVILPVLYLGGAILNKTTGESLKLVNKYNKTKS